MTDQKRKEIIAALSARWKYHDKAWRQELVSYLVPETGGVYGDIPAAWSSTATDDALRRARNLINQMLTNGIIQTTRERGRYRFIAWELPNGESKCS